MNKFLKLSTWMLAVGMLFTTACVDSDGPAPQPQQPKPEPEKGLEFVFGVGEVTSSAITFTITPNMDDAPYYAQLFAAEELVAERDIAMNAALMTTEEALFGKKTITVEGLTAESQYKVLYFGYDAAEKRFTTDYLVSDAIKTADFEINGSLEMSLIDDSVTWRDAWVKVVPSDDAMEYVFDIVEKSKWSELYAENPASVVEARIKGWEQDVKDGLESNPTLDTWQKYMQYYQHSYARTIVVSEYYNLRWDTEYVMYAFGMNDEGFQTADVVTLEFKTATPAASNNNFEVEIGDLTASSVAFIVTTTNDDPYFLTIQDKRYVDRFIGANAIETWEDMVWDLTFVKTDADIEALLFSGSQSLTNADISKNVDSLHDYQVVIWGFDNGPTTEVYVSEVFRPYDESVELSLYMQIDDVTSSTLTATVTASHDKPAYYIGCITAEQFGEDFGLEYINSLYGNISEDELYYGTDTYTFEGLASDTEYYVIAFGYDIDSALPTTELVYMSETTLSADSLD